jgi:hypothetical protein
MTSLSMEQQVQMSDQDTWFGKTYPEHSPVTPAKISEPSSKKQRRSATKPPLFLDLRKENGIIAESSWETGGALLGEYSMPNFGESPKEDAVSTLSQILEAHPHPKYYLSETACLGILRRAESRGKELPPILRGALMRQAGLPIASPLPTEQNGTEIVEPTVVETLLSKERTLEEWLA